jgi:hypothetical protein
MAEQPSLTPSECRYGQLANVCVALTCQETVAEAEGGYALTLRVTNIGDEPLRVRFPTAQQFDVTIANADGARLWSWSADRAFMQAAHGRILAAGESALYRVKWDGQLAGSPCRPGRYLAIARFLGDASADIPVATAEFSVGPRLVLALSDGETTVGGNH